MSLGNAGVIQTPFFVLDALAPLQEHLLNDHRQVLFLLLVLGLIQIHKHGDKRGLTVGGHQGHHLVLNGLNAPADFLPQPLLHHPGDRLRIRRNRKLPELPLDRGPDLLPAHLDKGRQMRQADGLPAVLVGGHLGNDLGGNVAGRGEGMGLFNHGAGNDRAVLQHILQIHQVAIVHMLGVIIRIMEVNDARLMGLHNFLRQRRRRVMSLDTSPAI